MAGDEIDDVSGGGTSHSGEPDVDNALDDLVFRFESELTPATDSRLGASLAALRALADGVDQNSETPTSEPDEAQSFSEYRDSRRRVERRPTEVEAEVRQEVEYVDAGPEDEVSSEEEVSFVEAVEVDAGSDEAAVAEFVDEPAANDAAEDDGENDAAENDGDAAEDDGENDGDAAEDDGENNGDADADAGWSTARRSRRELLASLPAAEPPTPPSPVTQISRASETRYVSSPDAVTSADADTDDATDAAPASTGDEPLRATILSRKIIRIDPETGRRTEEHLPGEASSPTRVRRIGSRPGEPVRRAGRSETEVAATPIEEPVAEDPAEPAEPAEVAVVGVVDTPAPVVAVAAVDDSPEPIAAVEVDETPNAEIASAATEDAEAEADQSQADQNQADEAADEAEDPAQSVETMGAVDEPEETDQNGDSDDSIEPAAPESENETLTAVAELDEPDLDMAEEYDLPAFLRHTINGRDDQDTDRPAPTTHRPPRGVRTGDRPIPAPDRRDIVHIGPASPPPVRPFAERQSLENVGSSGIRMSSTEDERQLDDQVGPENRSDSPSDESPPDEPVDAPEPFADLDEPIANTDEPFADLDEPIDDGTPFEDPIDFAPAPPTGPDARRNHDQRDLTDTEDPTDTDDYPDENDLTGFDDRVDEDPDYPDENPDEHDLTGFDDRVDEDPENPDEHPDEHDLTGFDDRVDEDPDYPDDDAPDDHDATEGDGLWSGSAGGEDASTLDFPQTNELIHTPTLAPTSNLRESAGPPSPWRARLAASAGVALLMIGSVFLLSSFFGSDDPTPATQTITTDPASTDPAPAENNTLDAVNPVAANAAGSTVTVNSDRVSAEAMTCNRLDGLSAIVETSESTAIVTTVTARFMDADGNELFSHEPVTVVAAPAIRSVVTFPYEADKVDNDDRFAEPTCELIVDEATG